jgi:hypothetical protein
MSTEQVIDNSLPAESALEPLPSTAGSKKKVGYLLIGALLFSLTAFCSRWSWANSDIALKLYPLIYLLMGYIHCRSMFKYLFPPTASSFSKGFWFTLFVLIMAVVTVGIIIGKLFNDNQLLHYHLMSTLFFPLPVLMKYAFEFFDAIPEKKYKSWYYPVASPSPDRAAIDVSVILNIHLHLSKSSTEGVVANFSAKAPLKMQLGTLFQIFIADYNEHNKAISIEYLDQKLLQPQGWHFYVLKGGVIKKRNYLDADLTFEENGIVDKSDVFAVRTDLLADTKAPLPSADNNDADEIPFLEIV